MRRITTVGLALTVALLCSIATSPASATSYIAKSWGENKLGQLGNGTTVSTTVPVAVSGLSEVAAVSANYYVDMALLQNGTVRSWGLNNFGDLGDGTTELRDEPVAVSGLKEVTAISAAGNGGLALLASGKVMDWGLNSDGQLGTGENTGPETCSGNPCSKTPVEVHGLSELGSKVVAISAGFEHNVALLADGRVMAWGNNEYGQLGDGTTTDRSTPVEVKGLGGEAAQVSASYRETVALLRSGKVMDWGEAGYGQLGNGESEGPEKCFDPPSAEFACSTKPVEVHGLSELTSKVRAVSAGYYYNLLVLEDGTVMTWGWNRAGELGNGEYTGPSKCSIGPSEEPCSKVPVAVKGVGGTGKLEGVREANASKAGHTPIALLNSGKAVTWGENNDGSTVEPYSALGIGTNKGPVESCSPLHERCTPTPVVVSGLVDVAAVSPGGGSNLALIPATSPPEYGRCVKLAAGQGAYEGSSCTKTGGERRYEWYPGVAQAAFTTTGGATTFEAGAGSKTIACESESGVGKYSGRTTLSGVVFAFHECKFVFGGSKCSTPGAGEGEVVTNPLNGRLGIEALSAEGAEGNKVALDAYPAESGALFANVVCGIGPVPIRGSVIVPVTTNTMSLSPKRKYKATSAKQKPEQFEGEAKDVLEASVFGSYLQTGLIVEMAQNNEERVEINTVA